MYINELNNVFVHLPTSKIKNTVLKKRKVMGFNRVKCEENKSQEIGHPQHSANSTCSFHSKM